MIQLLDCIDSDEMGRERRRELHIPRDIAAELGRTAVEAAERGRYEDARGRLVDWGADVAAARAAKVSIAPTASLPAPTGPQFPETRVVVTNETTLAASRRLVAEGHRPVALNFANGFHPGGGFLDGARAQEEVLCRSSALFATLVGDAMYAAHADDARPEVTDWAILSPGVPVFRTDAGAALASPWKLDVLTCAAPYAPHVGQPRSADLLRRRIHRVLAIARAYEYGTLVLGAWGCGAFRNDVRQTALDFRHAIETDFDGAFAEVVFAIVDWTPERRFLGPFRDVWGGQAP